MSAGATEVARAARVLAEQGLVDAFGHASARAGDEILITPPQPLGTLAAGAPLPRVALDAQALPDGVPKEAWIHLAIYAARPDVHAVCRAQPRAVTAAACAGLSIEALHGQGAFVGSAVPLYDRAALVRDRDAGRAVAAALGDGDALVLRGNGAVTVGTTPGEATAKMAVLEASAAINLAAAQAGERVRLSVEETAAWRSVAAEILERLWQHLAA